MRIELPTGPAVAEDPVAAWQTTYDAVQALLEEPATAESVTPATRARHIPLAEAVDRFYTSDVFMHAWDLAAATGQPPTLDADFLCRDARGHASRSRR